MHRARIDSPIGDLMIAGDHDTIVMLGRIRDTEPEAEWVRLNRYAAIKEAAQQLSAYWAGELFEFGLPLAPNGTVFQQKVWDALRTIPYGTTVSYGHIARRIGAPRACRAVGAANGRNPIGIVVPCHRVIGANGTLTGYAGGLDVKRQLLEHESRVVRNVQRDVSSYEEAG